MSDRVLVAIIISIILALGALIIFSGDKDNGDEVNASSLGSNNKIGTSEHNIVLMEAYSLSCPGCASYHPVLKQLREEYSDRVIFQAAHYPLSTKPGFQNARAGHRAVEAAARQGKFWEMHDVLFEKSDLWVNEPINPVPQIDLFAEELGLDLEQFKQDFSSSEVNDIISRDEAYLRNELGINATPTFFLNGRKLDNEREFSVSIELMRRVLDDALESAGGRTTPDPIMDLPESIQEDPEENTEADDTSAPEQEQVEQPVTTQ